MGVLLHKCAIERAATCLLLLATAPVVFWRWSLPFALLLLAGQCNIRRDL